MSSLKKKLADKLQDSIASERTKFKGEELEPADVSLWREGKKKVMEILGQPYEPAKYSQQSRVPLDILAVESKKALDGVRELRKRGVMPPADDPWKELGIDSLKEMTIDSEFEQFKDRRKRKK